MKYYKSDIHLPYLLRNITYMHTKWNNYKILFLDHKKIEKDYE